MRPFEDHFGASSPMYARARPRYPSEMVAWLAWQAPARAQAWDAATGTGRVAHLSSAHFERVYATDASASQLAEIAPREGLHVAVERAELPGLPDQSVDLITVGAAAHWLDLPSFYGAVRRVARPGAVLALFSYGVELRGAPELQDVLYAYATSIHAHWTPSYQVVVKRYQDMPFPFERIEMPEFLALSQGNLAQFLDLLRTWSGSLRAREATGADPLAPFEARFRQAWEQKGPVEAPRTLHWPIFGHIGRVG